MIFFYGLVQNFLRALRIFVFLEVDLVAALLDGYFEQPAHLLALLVGQLLGVSAFADRLVVVEGVADAREPVERERRVGDPLDLEAAAQLDGLCVTQAYPCSSSSAPRGSRSVTTFGRNP
jgi:hypothetical protein